MKFAEYYHLSTGWNGTDFTGPKEPIPMCGSDGVLYLDGRLSLPNLQNVAAAHAKQLNEQLGKGIVGYRICAGPRLTQSYPLSPYVSLSPNTESSSK